MDICTRRRRSILWIDRPEPGADDISRWFGTAIGVLHRQWQHIAFGVGVLRPLTAHLEFVHVLFFSIEGPENRQMQLG